MVAFLAGVSGLAAACPVVMESRQEPEPVLIPLPRGTERTVMAPCRRPGLVMTSPVQEVGIRVNVSLGVVKPCKPWVTSNVTDIFSSFYTV